MIPLRHASALDVAQTVNRMFAEANPRRRPGAGSRPSASPWSPTRARTAWSCARTIPSRLFRLRSLVAMLDTPTSAAGNIHVVLPEERGRGEARRDAARDLPAREPPRRRLPGAVRRRWRRLRRRRRIAARRSPATSPLAGSPRRRRSWRPPRRASSRRMPRPTRSSSPRRTRSTTTCARRSTSSTCAAPRSTSKR